MLDRQNLNRFMAEIGQIEMLNFHHNKKVKKKVETLLQNDLRFGASSHSAVVVFVQSEPLRRGPVHG
jgi:hypothetical protein